MRLVFQRKRSKVSVTVYREDTVVYTDNVVPTSVFGRKRILDAVQVDEVELLSYLLNATEVPSVWEVEEIEEASQVELPTIRVRGIREKRVDAVEFDSLEDALKYGDHTSPEPVIEWDDIEKIAALDIDVDDPRDLPLSVDPTPAYHWRTHGGGGRYIYFAIDGFTAEELAWVAAAGVKRSTPGISVEVKTETRHPLYKRGEETCSKVEDWPQSSDVGVLNSWLVASIDGSKVEEWLEESDFELGRAYEHSRCPADPDADSHGTPVYVGEHGILCHRCSAKGVRHGSKRPGWFPYSVLVPGAVPPTLGTLVKNLTHWEHAKHFVERVGLNDKCYSALCKLYHLDDPRVRSITSGEDLIRIEGRWVTRDLASTYTKDISRILSKLPACQYVEDGKVKVDGAMVERFRQGVDLTEWGYPALVPVRGVEIYGYWNEYDDPRRVNVVTPNSRHRTPDRERYRPRYSPGDVESAKSVIEEVFPGVDWNYLYLLIAAKGCVEGRIGLQPYILVSGPSGSAKSGTVDLAAAITGDHNTDIIYQPDTNRFRQSVHEAIDRGSYATLNEVLKEGKASKKSARETLDVVLNLTPNSVSHVLYVGPVALGRPPVFTFTDVAVPQSIRDDTQLARRFIYVPLHRRLDWEKTLASSGVLQIADFRHTDARYADAANVVLSDVIDTFFSEPTELKIIAKFLGYDTLENSTGFDDPLDDLRLFFDEVCKALPSDHDRYHGSNGWKEIRRGYETPLNEIWYRLHEEGSFVESRRVQECDWGRVLGVDRVVKCDLRPWKSRVFVRFRIGDVRSPELLNAEVIR